LRNPVLPDFELCKRAILTTNTKYLIIYNHILVGKIKYKYT